MSDFFNSYLVIGLVALVPLVLAGATLTLGRLVRPPGGSAERSVTYESGSDPTEGNWSQTHVRYYLFAILFVVFDVEVIFILPWALQVEALGHFGLIEMMAFVAILALGLAYAWRKKVFDWDS